MTPSERAQFLIQQLGYEKGEEHAIWASQQAEKRVTIGYWSEVADLIRQAQYAAYDKTINNRCRICDEPIPEGSGYCSECKPK